MRLNVTCGATANIAAVIVPTTMSAVVVVAQDKRVLCNVAVLSLLHVANPVKLFATMTFYNLVLLIL